MVRRIWTLAEANAAVFRVAEMMRRAQRHVAGMKQARDDLELLQAQHGDAMAMSDHDAHDKYTAAMNHFHRERTHLGEILQGFENLGVELKDVDAGLVDFRAQMGGNEVYLCWIQGEESVTHWHPLQGGFAARQPIPQWEDART